MHKSSSFKSDIILLYFLYFVKLDTKQKKDQYDPFYFSPNLNPIKIPIAIVTSPTKTGTNDNTKLPSSLLTDIGIAIILAKINPITPKYVFVSNLLNKYSINPQSTLFIGNDSRSDIFGAKSVGFSTYYVKSNISPQGDMAFDADYIVDDFKKWTI